ncbi:MAG: hypothetical protein WC457_03680 [Patescibacteria group bacterium]
MSITNFLDLSYWFHQPFIARGTSMWIWVGIFLGSVLVGLILKIVQQRLEEKYLKKIINSFGTIGLSVGLTGLLWLFFRQERVPFLAWRFWLVLIFGCALWRIVVHVIFLARRVPRIRAEHADKQIREKYLPKK